MTTRDPRVKERKNTDLKKLVKHHNLVRDNIKVAFAAFFLLKHNISIQICVILFTSSAREGVTMCWQLQ